LRALTSLITGVVVICALYFGRAVLIPIILAVLLSFLVAPFVDLLRRLKFGQVPSVIVAVLGTTLRIFDPSVTCWIRKLPKETPCKPFWQLLME